MTAFTLLLNILIVVLLGITIAYCLLLNRRIRILQDGRSELAQLLKHFDASTQRASESIIALQTASKQIGETIQLRIDKANYLLDDLAFMIEKGNKLANQMEAGFAVNRARTRVMTDPSAQENTSQPVIEPEARRELPLAPKPEVKPLTTREKTAATLEAVLGRVVGRAKPTEEEHERTVVRDRGQPLRARSRAEQELLDMIKAGIKG